MRGVFSLEGRVAGRLRVLVQAGDEEVAVGAVPATVAQQ